MLDKHQIQHFHQQGFLVLPELFHSQQLESLKAAAQEVIADFNIDHHKTIFTTKDNDRGRDQYFMDSAQRVHCFLEAEALDEDGNLLKPKHLCINKIGHAMHDLIPAFREFCSQPVFGNILRDIGYQQPILKQTMYIFKQPGIGEEVCWHQDATYLIDSPSRIIGLWVALEDATPENGCLWVQPEGHQTPLRRRFEVDHETGHGEHTTLNEMTWPTLEQAQAVPVKAGSLVLFDGHMPHFSSSNRSACSRQAFTMHVTEQHSTWSVNNWLQRPTLGDFLL
ncbi:phytanoyl-CoA dioxygenase family protein [Algicola sagamiensis]|uniref:phytanoyl-CoA dioxygenase family protein n=1 Tax=Algicola sagamiensis TaxID=163869 RepID=UPI0003627E47|nr:phytanoyl-CoA dioxygenase family protein [Algicola sagamiensis]